MKDIAIVGGGLVGSLWASFLAKRGFDITVYEKRPDMRLAGVRAGRSINLALSHRGWMALERIGVADIVRDQAIAMPGRMIHHLDRTTVFQPYGMADQAIYSVSRNRLNFALDTANDGYSNVRYVYSSRCADIDLESGDMIITDDAGLSLKVNHDFIFGTDGAFSKIRSAMQHTDRFDYTQKYLVHGYKELRIPPTEQAGFRIEPNALHIWPRGNFMLIALPNSDGSFTCTLFLPYEGEKSYERLTTPQEVTDFFELEFPDAVELMPTLTQDFFANPTSSLITVQCFPWSYKAKTLLLGDACHAIVPFYGQGMNAGFEDCCILDDMMNSTGLSPSSTPQDWVRTMDQYEQARKKDVDAIGQLALDNFIEMRDKVSDPQFILRKRIEKFLFSRYPDLFIPTYSQVTFSSIPYSEALANGKVQDRFFEELFAMEGFADHWENPVFEGKIDSLVHQYFGHTNQP